jgi:hypothetical protein
MVIKYAPSVSQVAGKVGGHYLQTSAGTPSLRTKRNSPNYLPRRSAQPKGRFAFLARSWNSLSGAQKTAWATWGALVPYFSGLDSTDPLFGYWCFQSCVTFRFRAGLTTFTAPGVFNGSLSSDVTLITATLSPLTLGGSKLAVGTGGFTHMYAQLNFGGEINPEIRKPILCGVTASGSTNISLIQTALRARYSSDIQATSISLFCISFRSGGAWFGMSGVSQWFFP